MTLFVSWPAHPNRNYLFEALDSEGRVVWHGEILNEYPVGSDRAIEIRLVDGTIAHYYKNSLFRRHRWSRRVTAPHASLSERVAVHRTPPHVRRVVEAGPAPMFEESLGRDPAPAMPVAEKDPVEGAVRCNDDIPPMMLIVVAADRSVTIRDVNMGAVPSPGADVWCHSLTARAMLGRGRETEH